MLAFALNRRDLLSIPILPKRADQSTDFTRNLIHEQMLEISAASMSILSRVGARFLTQNGLIAERLGRARGRTIPKTERSRGDLMLTRAVFIRRGGMIFLCISIYCVVAEALSIDRIIDWAVT